MDSATIYAALKIDSLQKATGSAFFLLFIFTFIFFLMTKVLEYHDRSIETKIKSMLYTSYMSLTAIVINYVHTTVAGTVFCFFLTFAVAITLMLLFLSIDNSKHIKKFNVGKFIVKGLLFLVFMTSFIVFNMKR